MPKYVLAHIRTQVVLEIRTIEAENPMGAIMASDEAGEIDRHIITNEVRAVSDLVKEEDADEQWRGRLIHAHADPKKKPPVEKIATAVRARAKAQSPAVDQMPAQYPVVR